MDTILDYELHPTLYIPDTLPQDSLAPLCDRSVQIKDKINTWDTNVVRRDVSFMYEYDLPEPGKRVTHCTEYYFNTKDVMNRVIDTFFVGYTAPDYPNDFLLLYHVGLNLSTAEAERTDGQIVEPGQPSWYWYTGPPCIIEEQPNRIFCNRLMEGDTFSVPWGGIFPIVGFRCSPLHGFEKSLQGKGYARLRWRRYEEEGISYDLRVQRTDGTDWDTLITTTDTAVLVEGLALGASYTSQVRKNCRYVTVNYDTTVHSDWSKAVNFTIDTYDWDGIDEVPALNFTLGPNPARDVTTVTLLERQAEGGRGEVADVHGRTWLSHPVAPEADRLTLDLAQLPAGAYLVKLVTPRGLSARRLVVRK